MGSATKRHNIEKAGGTGGHAPGDASYTEVDRLRCRWRDKLFATSYSAFARGGGELIWARTGTPFEPIHIATERDVLCFSKGG